MKTCSRCRESKPKTDFRLHRKASDGLQSQCKPCQIASKREARAGRVEHYRAKGREHRQTPAGRARHQEWTRRNRDKVLAHKAVHRAVAGGKLTRPESCPRCGTDSSPIHGHHENYSRPLEVEWMCARCHSHEHWKEHPSFGVAL